MQIDYLSKSVIPSRAANSVHVMKMCQAFASLGHRVTLHSVAPEEDETDLEHETADEGSRAASPQNKFEHYGVAPLFEIAQHSESHHFATHILSKLQQNMPSLRIGPIRQMMMGYFIATRHPVRQSDLLYGRHLFWLLGASLSGKDFIFESHTPPRRTVERIAQRLLFRRPGFRRLVVISAKLKEMYLQELPTLPAKKILVAHDGADAPDLKTPPAIEKTGGRLQIGYIGHLYPGRGIELVLEAADQLPEADFHIVGGNEEDVAALRAKSTSSNLQIHGFVPPGALGRYYASFDVFLAPYQKKVAVHGGGGDTSAFMSPLKIFEYMSWGRAILASDLPVLREVLTTDKTALLLPPDRADVWVETLRELIEDPDRAKHLGKTAQDVFNTSYSWKTRAHSILEAESF